MRPTVGVLSDFTVAPGAFAAARASRVDLACPRGLRPTSRSMLPRSTSPTTTSLVEARASGGRSPCGSACAIRPRRRRSVMRLLVAVPRLTSSRTIGSCLRVEVRLKLGRARLPSWAATRGCHAQLRRRRRHELKLVPRVGTLALRVSLRYVLVDVVMRLLVRRGGCAAANVLPIHLLLLARRGEDEARAGALALVGCHSWLPRSTSTTTTS